MVYEKKKLSFQDEKLHNTVAENDFATSEYRREAKNTHFLAAFRRTSTHMLHEPYK